MNEEKEIDEAQERLEEDFRKKWGAGVEQEVTVARDEYQFKTTDKGKIVEIVSENHARVEFEPQRNGGVFHMDNLKAWNTK
jgi:hypothetical protein